MILFCLIKFLSWHCLDFRYNKNIIFILERDKFNMNEELIEEMLSNGFDVYEALENYNLEIIDNEITG